MYDLIVLSAEAAPWGKYSELGFRSLGAHKISWIARKHGYSSITIGKLHILTEDQHKIDGWSFPSYSAVSEIEPKDVFSLGYSNVIQKYGKKIDENNKKYFSDIKMHLLNEKFKS